MSPPRRIMACVRDCNGTEHTARCIATRPKWKNVYERYMGGYQRRLQYTGQHRQSDASLVYDAVKGLRDSSVTPVNSIAQLNDWLRGVNDYKRGRGWGCPDIVIRLDGTPQRRRLLIRKICGHNGVIIIIRKEQFFKASLWELCKVIDGNIEDGDVIYFWRLQNYLTFYSWGTMDQAARDGFNVIVGASRFLGVEVGINIYKQNMMENKFYLGGLSLGTDVVVEMANNPNGAPTVAFVHTHVLAGERNRGALFFSAQDFYQAHHFGIPVYVRHINNPRIFRADPLQPSQPFEDDMTRLDGREARLQERNGCNLRERCSVTINTDLTEGPCQEMENQVRDEAIRNGGNVAATLERLFHEWDMSYCAFGIFIRHGQRTRPVPLNQIQTDE